jgi:hypothetical protein
MECSPSPTRNPPLHRISTSNCVVPIPTAWQAMAWEMHKLTGIWGLNLRVGTGDICPYRAKRSICEGDLGFRSAPPQAIGCHAFGIGAQEE